MMFKKYLLIMVLSVFAISTFAQSSPKEGIYIDKEGKIRWNKDKKEAFFYGVNYSSPFVFGYRHIKATGQTVEKAIQDDVYHLSRMGLNAFRIHVFDTEMTDSVGNIINNDHLRLFDFLVAELKKRNIKIFITPIAYWGNGYPEKDIPTGSFSFKYGKKRALVEKEAWSAQERYLTQFFTRKNQYTGLTYQDDPDVLATEVNNEPQHSGAQELTTQYINQMVEAIRKTGWKKPVFYNISESPTYASAIVKANVQGHTFQWYPSGLVANHTQKGNFLPHVSEYKIPFDTIPGFANRAKVVYEFDAADIYDSYMYPAMARSFKNAGFQWATMFAYDPMAIADVNTEYQTHYLNLAYTPSKAISMLIASKTFRKEGVKGKLAKDSVFADVTLSAQKSWSVLNNESDFYYSNSTEIKPLNTVKLKHIAGVGSSSVINYTGTGAYFLDEIENGIWRLEVMPDAINIRDPFERASPKKKVTLIDWKQHDMIVDLVGLGTDFSIKGINSGNDYKQFAEGKTFKIAPGTYLLSKNGITKPINPEAKFGVIKLNDFVAPKASADEIFVNHQPQNEISEGENLLIKAKIAGVGEDDVVKVYFQHLNNIWSESKMVSDNSIDFQLSVPANLLKEGLLRYRIVVESKKGKKTFPGNLDTNPGDWDFYSPQAYETSIVRKNAPLELFNANFDRDNVNTYHPDWTNYGLAYVATAAGKQLAIQSTIRKAEKGKFMGWQSYVGSKILARELDLNTFKSIVVQARSTGSVKAKIALITKQAKSYATIINLDSTEKEIEITLNSLKPEDMLLLPRPYPGFQNLFFKSDSKESFNLKDVEKIEVTFGYDLSSDLIGTPVSIEVAKIGLK